MATLKDIAAEAAAGAADDFTIAERFSDMHEVVMQMRPYFALREKYRMLPEQSIEAICERTNVSTNHHSLAGIGVVDLVVLDERSVIGVVEFKRWKPCDRDRERIDGIMAAIPTCRFGARMTLVQLTTDRKWLAELEREWGAAERTRNRFFSVDIDGPKDSRGYTYAIAVQATLRPANGMS